MDLVKMRGSGFETAADRRKGAAAVVAWGLKEKRLPHQVRQSLFTAAHCRSAATQPQRYHRKDELSRFLSRCAPDGKGELLEYRGNCRLGDRGQGFDTGDAIFIARCTTGSQAQSPSDPVISENYRGSNMRSDPMNCMAAARDNVGCRRIDSRRLL